MEKLKNKQFVKEVLDSINVLKERERNIIILRYGLNNEHSWTLENIGKKFQITRERARQIINQAKKRLVKIKNPKLQSLFNLLEKQILANGGVIGEKGLIGHFGHENEPEILGSVNLIAESDPDLKYIKVDHMDVFWTTEKADKQDLNNIIEKGSGLLKTKGKIVNIDTLVSDLKKEIKKFDSDFIKSLLSGAYNTFVIREDKIGLISWPEINPKNTRNKINYVLEYANKPLHFKDIAERIRFYKFAGKTPSAATVHNELIADKRFVLIGKGIYALRKWGYNEGTVQDLIIEMLTGKKSMMQEDIIEKVLDQRQVAKNTIIMNLVSKPMFKRIQGHEWGLVKK